MFSHLSCAGAETWKKRWMIAFLSVICVLLTTHYVAYLHWHREGTCWFWPVCKQRQRPHEESLQHDFKILSVSETKSGSNLSNARQNMTGHGEGEVEESGDHHLLLSGLKEEFLMKTDSGWPRDAEVNLFALANPESSLRFNTHWSAPPVSALARSRGPRKMS